MLWVKCQKDLSTRKKIKDKRDFSLRVIIYIVTGQGLVSLIEFLVIF